MAFQRRIAASRRPAASPRPKQIARNGLQRNVIWLRSSVTRLRTAHPLPIIELAFQHGIASTARSRNRMDISSKNRGSTDDLLLNLVRLIAADIVTNFHPIQNTPIRFQNPMTQRLHSLCVDGVTQFSIKMRSSTSSKREF
jgi:hypothetical protein